MLENGATLRGRDVILYLFCFNCRRKAFPSPCQEEIFWPEQRTAQGRVEPTSFHYWNASTWRRVVYKVSARFIAQWSWFESRVKKFVFYLFLRGTRYSVWRMEKCKTSVEVWDFEMVFVNYHKGWLKKNKIQTASWKWKKTNKKNFKCCNKQTCGVYCTFSNSFALIIVSHSIVAKL